jgi:Tol biopolymer transport system component
MTLEREERVRELLEAALKREASQRVSYLKAVCPDESLRAEVTSLLSKDAPAANVKAPEDPGSTDHDPGGADRRGTLTIGQVLSERFRVVRFIGHGGMGEVYLAQDERLDREVAVKVVPLVADPSVRKRLHKEARALSKLSHPNIESLIDFVSQGGLEFLVVEYIAGETLSDIISRGPLPEKTIARLGAQLAMGLAAAHAEFVVHRDLKPGNLRVTSDGRLKILDFGIAKTLKPPTSDSTTDSSTGGLAPAGTLPYMAPEQLHSQPADARSDIYGAGNVLYEMATGQRTFRAETSPQLIDEILHLPPVSPRALNARVSPEMERIILKCLQKEPENRYQSAQELEVDLRQLAGPETAYPSARPSAGAGAGWFRSRQEKIARTAQALAVVFLLVVIVVLLSQRGGPPSALKEVSPLTFDAGLTWDPTLSADGKVMAYSSDRAGHGSNLDIWIKNVAAGEAMRVTHGPPDNVSPSLSPDGSTIAYRSEREGGGIYVTSAYGGYERLVAKFGLDPRFSPDGTELLYWTGEERTPYDLMAPGAKIYVTALRGGPPRQLQPDFIDARYPAWGPDGHHVMFQGSRTVASSYQSGSDWWVAPLEGGNAVKTGAFDILRDAGLTLYGCPFYWANGVVVFAAQKTYGANLWQVAISPTDWHASGPVTRLTAGTAKDTVPWLTPGGRLVFTTMNASVNIWSVPESAAGKTNTDDLSQLTKTVAADLHPSVSRNGEKLVFIRRVGLGREHDEVWFKDTRTGQEAPVGLPTQAIPELSHDGSKVAYSVIENGQAPIYTAGLGGGPSQRVCDDCGEILDWSSDQSSILYSPGKATSVGLLDVASKRKTILLARTNSIVDQARFSPDGKWVAFVSSLDADHSIIELARLGNQAPIPEVQWIHLTHGTDRDFKPAWSSGGSAIFLYSNRDGFTCIWKVLLDPETKLPRGEPVPVQHFHSAGLSLEHLATRSLNLSVGGGMIAFDLAEAKGNIFKLELGRH